MKYIKAFQNSQDLQVSVGNSYTEDHFINIFLDNFIQYGKYTAHVVSHHEELSREEAISEQTYMYLFIFTD